MSKKAKRIRSRVIDREPRPKPVITAAVTLSLSANNDSFVITLPGIPGISRPHAVVIPFKPIEVCKCKHNTFRDADGNVHDRLGFGGVPIECDIADHVLSTENKALMAMHSTLLARKIAAEQGESPSIGSKAVPTQALIDAFLKAGGKIQDDAERARRELDKYGDEFKDTLSKMDLTI